MITQDFVILAIGFIASSIWYYFYLKDMFSGSSKPHMFTWLIWAITGYTGFWIQVMNGWWIWSLVMLYFAIIPTIIFLYAAIKGEKNIENIDYLFLSIAWISLMFWLILDMPIVSILLLLSIDIMAYLPTVRKSFMQPFDETLSLFALVNIWYLASILTFDELIFINYSYPAALIIINILFISYILIRRKQLS